MNLLDRLSWPALVAELAPGPAEGAARRLAVAVEAAERLARRRQVEAAVAAAGPDLDPHEAAVVAAWLAGHRRSVLAATTPVPDLLVVDDAPGPESRVVAAVVDKDDTPTGLVLDAALADLDPPLVLLPLLEDLGDQLGRLVVVVDDLDDRATDGCWWSTRHVLVVDRRLLAGPRDRLDEVVAHEAAHVLDDRLAERSIDAAEALADVLAPWLLAERPATVADAAPLVSAARPPNPIRHPDLPPPGPASTATWLLNTERTTPHVPEPAPAA